MSIFIGALLPFNSAAILRQGPAATLTHTAPHEGCLSATFSSTHTKHHLLTCTGVFNSGRAMQPAPRVRIGSEATIVSPKIYQ